jgi:hypothetical protein
MQSSLSLAWYKHEAPGNVPVPGLPDGIFAYQTYQFGYILDGFGMENIAKFACYLVYFMTNWYFYYYLVFWVHCYSFGKLYQDKSGNPALNLFKEKIIFARCTYKSGIQHELESVRGESSSRQARSKCLEKFRTFLSTS